MAFNPGFTRAYDAPYAAHIRNVIVKNDSLIYGGTQSLASQPELTFSTDALRFEYATTSFDLTASNTFQVKLEPLDEAWGDWTAETQKDYTNLPENRYTFHVRARNVYGVISEEAAFSFTVLPPWYRTWWAYSLYALGGLGLVLGAVQLRTGQFAPAKSATGKPD